MLKERESSESPAAPDECAGCGGRIQDRYYLLAVDRQWHGACLRCCECRMPLDTELTCFSRDGNIYCKEDYYRLFCVKRCARCGNGITANELVMRAKDMVYHLTCFTCVACGTLLSKGDVFGMRDGMVYCRPHYDNACLDEYCEEDNNSVYSVACGTLLSKGDVFGMRDGKVYCRPHYDTACLDEYCEEDINSVYRCQELHNGGDSPSQFYAGGANPKGRPRKRKVAQGSPEDMQVQTIRMTTAALEILHRGDLSSSMESLAYDSSVTSPGSVSGHAQRTKRMRTSFKHHQLRTMKSYFAINQNPDAKDLKQLAQKTGLSKRVLQVWFQNARAKWRRNIMRSESNHGPMNPNNNPGHPVNGSIVPGVLPPGPTNMMMSEPLQPIEEMRVHTPLQHPMVFNEMY